MNKMTKDEIISIGNEIINESDIIANHGASIANAISICNTGFNFNRTSMVIQKSKDIKSICSYGWKENSGNDAANIVIEIPKEFIKKIMNYEDKEYSAWIKYILDNNYQEVVINSMLEKDIIEEENQVQKESNQQFFIPPIQNINKFNFHLPKEFIKGYFAYTDGKNYIYYITHPEEDPLNNLTFVSNPFFFNNLSIEEQNELANSYINKFEEEKNERKR